MSRKIRRAAAAAVALAAIPAGAQDGWTLRAAGPDTTLALALGASLSESAALDSLHQRGYLQARLDSVARDTVFATAGTGAVVASLDVIGGDGIMSVTLGWQTERGGPFRPSMLRRDLTASADAFARAGYPDARVTPDVRVVDEGRGVEITVRIDPGTPATVSGVELVGGRGANRAFASRITGVQPGTPPGEVNAARVRQSLDATGLYTAVGEPVLARTAAGDLVLQVPVAEAAPGTFDLVLGFLPPVDGAAAQVVGSGRVDLRNVFGGGRAVHLELVRNPGLVSTFDVAVRDPFVLGSPVGLGARFEGTSRDSTFSRQRLALDVTYPLAPGLTLLGGLSNETIRPGTYGARLVDGVPRVRRADAFYVGAGVEYVALDAPRSPRRGVRLAVFLEQGRPRRALGESAPETSTGVHRRLVAEARGYVPTLRRQGAVLGADVSVVRASEAVGARLDEAELFRIGGARSLRGYDEDAFIGSVVGRAFAEYRLHLDAETFAFAFGDLGFVARPALPDLPASRRLLPGYGAGVRLQTGLGLASISYALNPDLPLGRGKVHVGLAVGL